MTNTYRALSGYGKAIYGEDVFEGGFTAAEEQDHLNGKHLELVPRKYKVLSDNFSGGTKGGEYVAGLQMEIEAALVAGGHLIRDDAPVAKKAAAKKE